MKDYKHPFLNLLANGSPSWTMGRGASSSGRNDRTIFGNPSEEANYKYGDKVKITGFYESAGEGSIVSYNYYYTFSVKLPDGSIVKIHQDNLKS